MENSFDEHVAIFWDYENCSPPCSVPGYDVVNNIRQVAHDYGSVKMFKAYLELSEQSSSKSIALRSELQSCGVSLTDCPHNGRKDVADKMMIVDMLTYVIDNPAPATIVLISGDRDFVYAVSVLRLRRYRVVLVAPNCAHASLKSQASVCLEWETDIMRKTTARPQTLDALSGGSDDSLQQRSPMRPPLSFGGSMPQTGSRHTRRQSFKADAPLTPVTPQNVSDGPDISSTPPARHHSEPSIVTADEALLPPLPRCCTELTSGLSAFSTNDPWNGLGHDEIPPPIPDIVDYMRLLTTDKPLSSLISTRCPEVSSSEGTMASVTPLSPAIILGRPSESLEILAQEYPMELHGIEDHEQCSHKANNPGNSPSPFSNLRRPIASTSVSFLQVGRDAPLMRPASVEPLSGTPSEASSLSLSTSSPEGSDFHVPQLRPMPYMPQTSSSYLGKLRQHSRLLPPDLGFPTSDVTCIADVPPVPSTSHLLRDVGSSRPRELMPHWDTNDRVTAAPDPTSDPTVLTPNLASIPAHFHPLMQVLEQSRLRGTENPLRSWVGLQIPKETYKQAAVSGFKRYSLAAEKAGIIVLGGLQAGAWISLSPQWYGRIPVGASLQ